MPVGGGTETDQRNAQVNLSANVDSYVTGMDRAQRSTMQTAGAVDYLDQKVQNLGKRIQSGLLHFAERDFAALGIGTAAAATYDKQLGTLAGTAAVTRQNFAGIKGAVEGAFTSLPASRTSIIQLIETLNELGITGDRQLGQLAKTFIKLGYATGEGPNELAQGLVQLSRLMGQTDASRIANYANSLLTVSKYAGVSATGVLSFAQAIAPMARQAGIGEAAVLGISAAFSKAGSDGYLAAGAFNKIVGDITNLTQTGSPDLAKYANLIGVTTGHLKTMDKTTALQSIFSTISKQGPQAIVTLNRLGIDGVRAQSAITAVVQSGNLDEQIARAQGSSSNQNNLNRGSRAAMNNLADDLSRVRNELTQFGTEIGETFIGPLKVAVDVVDSLLHALNMLVKPFAPLIAGAAAFAGSIAGVAGAVAGLSHLVLAGGLAALLLRSGPGLALRQGVAAGRSVVGETEAMRTERLAGNASAAMYARAGSEMPLRARIPFLIGRGVGELRGPIDPNAPAGGPGALRQAARMAVRAPGLIVAGGARAQSRFLRDAALRDPYARSAYEAPAAGASARVFSVGASGTATLREETVARKGAIAGLRDWTKTQYTANKASVENEGTVRALSRTMIDATKAVAQFGVQTARTGASLVTGGRLGGGAAAAGAAEAGAAGAVRGGLLGRALGGAKSVAGGLGPLGWGLIAASTLPSLTGAIRSRDNQAYQVSDVNSISKYDQLLGQTSTNLAKFSDAISSASSDLSAFANKTLPQVAKVTPGDVSAATTSYKVTDPNLAKLAKAAPRNVNAAVGYIQGLAVQHGGMDSATLNAVKKDLIASYGPGPAQRILDAYIKTQPGPQANINYGQLGSLLQGQGGGTFRSLAGQLSSGLVSQAQVAPGRRSSRAELSGILQLYGRALTTNEYGGQSDNIKQVRALLAKTFGGGQGDYRSQLPTAGETNVTPSYADTGDIQRRLLTAIGATQGGRRFLGGAGIDWSKISKLQGPQFQSALSGIVGGLGPASFPGPQQSELASRVSATGPLGRFAESNKTVQAAYAQPESPALQYQAMMGLFQQAGGQRAIQTGSTDKLMGAFDKLTGTIGDTSDQLYIMARAAKSYAQQQEQYALPFMSRTRQFGTTAREYRQEQITQRTAPGPDTAADLQGAQTNYQQQLQSQTQFEIQVLQSARQYGLQMKRAEEDKNISIYRSERDFNIQMEQSAEDFHRSMFRSQRDHDRQMAQQAQSSAQTIYNPYLRVQSAYTASGATLEQNLLDQNTRLRRQKSELNQLKAAGLSMKAIQTLDLANPNNAQQLDRLFQELIQNPNEIGQINAASGERIKLTKSLTQSDFNLSFQQTQINYQQGIRDASKDYNIARERAVEAQQRSLSDMASDYNRMVKRSAQDLAISMTELYGTFADNYGRTLAAINDKIGKYAPGIAAKLTQELRAMRHAIDVASGYDPTANHHGTASPPSGPQGSGGSTARRSPTGPVRHNAMGSISTSEHVTTMSEGNRPEMILPLDARGQQFMASFYSGISAYLVRTLNARSYGSVPSGQASAGMGVQTLRVDQGNYFTGPVTVQASDPMAMARALEARARIARLASPAHAASSR